MAFVWLFTSVLWQVELCEPIWQLMLLAVGIETFFTQPKLAATILDFISPPENDSFRKDLCFSPDVFLVPPKVIACGADLSFTPDVFYLFIYFFSTREISEMRGPTGVKFCTMVSNRPYFIMPVQNFAARTRKKFQGPKTCKIWPDFGPLRSSAANISETDEYIQNRIFIPSTSIPPALGETIPVKFGPVTLKISMLNRTHPKCIFRKNIFRPLGLLRPQIFTRARESPSLTSAPLTGAGAPLTTFFKGKSKNGLKCNEGALITSELGGVAGRNFGT